MQWEYRMYLDVHSLGLTGLRCLVEMMPSLSSGTAATAGVPEFVLVKLDNLNAAWRCYWCNAKRLWQPVFDVFRGQGTFASLRATFTKDAVYRIVNADLCAIRKALREAREACRHLSRETGLAGLPPLCDALLLMIKAGEENDGLLPRPEKLSRSREEASPSGSTLSPGSSRRSHSASSRSFDTTDHE